MPEKMKGITCCADCAYYNMKKHRCTRASDEGKPTDHFYADCPLPTVTPEPGWISVKDRLPSTDDLVLFAVGEHVIFGYYDGKDWYQYEGQWDTDVIYLEPGERVTHWMPLPEPPKEGT